MLTLGHIKHALEEQTWYTPKVYEDGSKEKEKSQF